MHMAYAIVFLAFQMHCAIPTPHTLLGRKRFGVGLREVYNLFLAESSGCFLFPMLDYEQTCGRS